MNLSHEALTRREKPWQRTPLDGRQRISADGNPKHILKETKTSNSTEAKEAETLTNTTSEEDVRCGAMKRKGASAKAVASTPESTDGVEEQKRGGTP